MAVLHGHCSLPTQLDTVVMRASYRALVSSGTATTFVCDVVGNPPTSTGVGCCGITTIPLGPDLPAVPGLVTFQPPTPLWTFASDDFTAAYIEATGACHNQCTIEVPLRIANTAANTDLRDTAGFSMSLTHDASYLTPVGVALGATPASLQQMTTTLQAGTCAVASSLGPEIVMTNITASGVSIHVQNTIEPTAITDSFCLASIDWGAGDTAAIIEYAVDTTSLAGDSVGATTTLQWADIGDDVGNSVSCAAPRTPFAMEAPALVTTNDITISFVPARDFIRGDCNGDGALNITDAIYLLNGYIAQPTVGPPSSCPAACDTNDDASVNISDVPFFLSYLFAAGPAPAAPFPNCGSVAGAMCAVPTCP